MRFADFLTRAPHGAPTCTRAVSFRALRPGDPTAPPVDVTAVIAPMSEEEREQVRVDAAAALRKRFPDDPIPLDVQADEALYHRIAACLRNPDKPAETFFVSVTECRGALTLPVARDLADEIEAFQIEEFPPAVDSETMARLEKEAREKSLRALLSDAESSPAGRRALRGFLARCMRSLTQT